MFKCPCHLDEWVNENALNEHLANHYRVLLKSAELRTAEVQREKEDLEQLVRDSHGEPEALKDAIRRGRKRSRSLRKEERQMDQREEALMKRAVVIRVKEMRIAEEERRVGERILAMAENS